MGKLFSTDPVVATVDSVDHSYSEISETESNDQYICTRTNLSSELIQEDKVTVKQSKKRTPAKAYVSKTKSHETAEAGVRKPSNVALSINTDKAVPLADLQLELDILIELAKKPDFLRNLIHGAN